MRLLRWKRLRSGSAIYTTSGRPRLTAAAAARAVANGRRCTVRWPPGAIPLGPAPRTVWMGDGGVDGGRHCAPDPAACRHSIGTARRARAIQATRMLPAFDHAPVFAAAPGARSATADGVSCSAFLVSRARSLSGRSRARRRAALRAAAQSGNRRRVCDVRVVPLAARATPVDRLRARRAGCGAAVYPRYPRGAASRPSTVRAERARRPQRLRSQRIDHIGRRTCAGLKGCQGSRRHALQTGTAWRPAR
jgi:hypothetical protein